MSKTSKSKLIVLSSTRCDVNFLVKYKNHINNTFKEIERQLILYRLDDRELDRQLSACKSETIELAEISNKYSFKGLCNNGFLSHSNRIVEFFDHLIAINYIPNSKHAEDILSAITLFRIVSQNLFLFHRNRCNRTLNGEQLPIIVNDLAELKSTLSSCNEYQPLLFNYYTKFNFFWITPESKPWIRAMQSLLSFPSTRFPIFFRLFERKYSTSSFLDLSLNASYDAPLKTTSLVDSHFINRALRGLNFNTKTVCKTIRIPAQGKYILAANKIDFVHLDQPMSVNHTIRCRLIHHSIEDNKNQTIIFYCHGGGMITSRPELHEVSCCLKKMRNLISRLIKLFILIIIMIHSP